jgi:exopolyphosphatase/guanosine-5'-triphosphate,3'-diphosphate pyrophosphatase
MAVSQYLKQDSSLRRGDTMVIEVGGGSTEVLILRRGTVTSAHTYRLGSSRLLKLADQYSPVRDKMRDVMQGHADRVIKAIAEEMGRTRPGEMLLLGSDARVAAAAVVPEWNRTDLIRLPTSELGRLAGKALSRPVENVAESFGIPHSEAEVLGPALLLYSRFAEMLGVESVSVGAATLRDGIVRELAAGEEWTAGFRRQIIHSALTIGRKYRFDEKHAREVTRLAVFLFDRLRDEHGLGSRAEMILQVAGLLHDVGSFIGANGHHKHSMYLIANSDIFGLGSVDTKMAACIARYHRRAAPDAGHPEYMALDRENRIVVSKLAAILRLADAMDRSHAQRCRHLEVDLSPGLMTITVLRAGNIMVEQQGMREKSGMFEQVFGRKVILRD